MQLFISPETRARLIEKYKPTNKSGLIRTLIVIVVGIILVSVLGFDIRAAVEHPQTQTNFSYLGTMIANLWNTYIADIWAVLWNIAGPIFDFFWNGAQNFNWTDYNNQVDGFINNAPALPSIE